MTKRRQTALLWTAAVACMGAIAAFAVPALWVAGRCIADYSDGEHLEARVVRDEAHGVSLQTDATPERRADECIMPHGELPARGVELGERFEVVLHTRIPGRCTTLATLEASTALYYALFATLVVLNLGILLVALVIQRSLNTVPVPTTHLELSARPPPCPRCSKPMTEGYLPLIAGIHWRDAGQPAGLPHALGGLPGTVGWRGRPRLHGYRCEPCEIVLFRYGKER